MIFPVVTLEGRELTVRELTQFLEWFFHKPIGWREMQRRVKKEMDLDVSVVVLVDLWRVLNAIRHKNLDDYSERLLAEHCATTTLAE